MPSFSKSSLSRLETCDDRLQALLKAAIEHWDFAVLEGHRNKERQNEAFEQGLSKLEWPASPHNRWPSMAVDIAPSPIDWKDRERFIYFAGKIMALATLLEIPLRWGGDWNGNGKMTDETFRDLVHFEIDWQRNA